MFTCKPQMHPQRLIDLTYWDEPQQYEAVQLLTPDGFILAARHKQQPLIRQLPFCWTTPDTRIEIVPLEEVQGTYQLGSC